MRSSVPLKVNEVNFSRRTETLTDNWCTFYCFCNLIHLFSFKDRSLSWQKSCGRSAGQCQASVVLCMFKQFAIVFPRTVWVVTLVFHFPVLCKLHFLNWVTFTLKKIELHVHLCACNSMPRVMLLDNGSKIVQ